MPVITEVGEWSKIKLDIIKEYAAAYSKILNAQTKPSLYHIYIDAFSGAGIHLDRSNGSIIEGSPLLALQTSPPFREYHFIDLDKKRTDYLADLVSQSKTQSKTIIHAGDASTILLKDIFPHVRYSDYRRSLCLLDPYGMHYSWQVVETAGKMRSIELFFNFPIEDINRSILRKHRDLIDDDAKQRMNIFWGDDSWFDLLYTDKRNLFGIQEKLSNEKVVHIYRQRLKTVAGFNHISPALPIRNSKNAIIYYLILASPKIAAYDIISHIFDKYRLGRGLKNKH